MAKKNNNHQVADASATTEEVVQENITVEQAALSLVQQFEMECAKAHEQQRGQSLPMRDIIEGIDLLMDAAQVSKASVRVLAEKVPMLLKVKYAAMGNSTNLMAVKMGHVIKKMPNNEIRELRERQLAHMLDPKTKDNFYRRIYNVGFRGEGKRFSLDNGDLVRVAKTKQ
jgi:uroporphyrinogen-III synthase